MSRTQSRRQWLAEVLAFGVEGGGVRLGCYTLLRVAAIYKAIVSRVVDGKPSPPERGWGARNLFAIDYIGHRLHLQKKVPSPTKLYTMTFNAAVYMQAAPIAQTRAPYNTQDNR